MKLSRFLLSVFLLMLSIGYCRAFENKVIITQNDGNVVQLEMISGMVGGIMERSEPNSETENKFSLYLLVSSGFYEYDENGDPISGVNPDTGEEGTIWFYAPVYSLKDIIFDYDYATDVEKIMMPNVSVSINDGKIKISGVDKPVEVVVSRLSGLMVLHNIYSTDSEIDLTLFGNDLYLIKVGNTTYKMLVKK